MDTMLIFFPGGQIESAIEMDFCRVPSVVRKCLAVEPKIYLLLGSTF